MVKVDQFKWISSGINYMGAKLCVNIANILQINVTSALTKIKQRNGPSDSLTSRAKINTTKTAIARRLNCPLMLPITIPDELFKQYHQMVLMNYFGRKGRNHALYNKK